MSKKQIVLPSNYNELTFLVKKAIELYQGSPVKNNNKFNEVMAKSLDFENFDTLSSILKSSESEDEIKTIEIDINSSGNFVIDGVEIDSNNEIFDGGLSTYSLAEVEDRIYWLRQYIADAKKNGNATYEMEKDLHYLESCKGKDTFVLASIGGSGFISASLDPEDFNYYCLEILEYYSDTIKKEYTLDDLIEIFNNPKSTIQEGDNCWECKSCHAEWSYAMSEDDIPYFCPFCINDVEVIDVRKSGNDFSKLCTKNYAVKFSLDSKTEYVEFDTLCLARDFQRQYRKIVGLDEYTGY